MKTPFVLVAVGLALATPVFAQSTDDRVRVSFGGALTAGAIDGEPSFAASAGYRFADHLSFDVEVTFANEAADRFANRFFPLANGLDFGTARVGNLMMTSRSGAFRTGPNVAQAVLRAPIPIEGTNDGSTFLTTAGFRYEFPVQGTRFVPYLSGGMGLARTEESFNIALATTPTSGPNRAGTTASTIPVIDESISHTGVMASAGIGASLRVFRGLSVDLNARYFRLDRSRNLGSFGGGVSYRF